MKNRILITGADGSLGSTLVDMAEKLNYEVIKMPKDLVNKPEIDKFISECGKVDSVIFNHGINHLSWIGETEEKDENILLVNVMSPYWILNALVANKNTCRGVFVTSQTYRVPQRTTSLYCASKAALNQMMKVAARELAPKGWVLNAVAPGKIFDTKMSEMTDAQVNELRGWTQKQAEGYAHSLIPLNRFTYKEEIAQVIFKTLDMPAYVCGSTVEAFGGL